MLYYKMPEEYEFFERKRYDLEKIPKWKQINFLLSKKEMKGIKEKINNSEEEIPKKIWEKIIKIFEYKDTGMEIQDLKEYAINKNPNLKRYLEEGKIKTFKDFELNDGKTLLEKTKEINIESYSSMYEFFKRGEHIGNCGRTSRFIGVIFDSPQYHTGNFMSLVGTKNCNDGGHAWVETKINNKNYIVDTSMMLVIPLDLKEKIGYKDKSKAWTVYDIINYTHQKDMYFNHYKEMTKYTTKNKFSYASYIENIKKIEKVTEMER